MLCEESHRDNSMSEFDRKGKPTVTLEESAKLAVAALKCIFDIDSAKVKFVSYTAHGVGGSPIIRIEGIQWSEDLLTVLQRLRARFWVDLRADTCECDDCRKSKYGPLNILVLELTPNDLLEKEFSQ